VTPHMALIKHDPDNGQWGDCFRTAIACLLDLPPESVPHVCTGGEGTDKDATDRMDHWLRENHGVAIMCMAVDADVCPLGSLFNTMKMLNPEVYWLLIGKSRTGCVHNVICRGGEIIHDPTPGNPGIVGPRDEGFYWVNVLTPCFRRPAVAA